jgi:hypothetical protein
LINLCMIKKVMHLPIGHHWYGIWTPISIRPHAGIYIRSLTCRPKSCRPQNIKLYWESKDNLIEQIYFS